MIQKLSFGGEWKGQQRSSSRVESLKNYLFKISAAATDAFSTLLCEFCSPFSLFFSFCFRQFSSELSPFLVLCSAVGSQQPHQNSRISLLFSLSSSPSPTSNLKMRKKKLWTFRLSLTLPTPSREGFLMLRSEGFVDDADDLSFTSIFHLSRSECMNALWNSIICWIFEREQKSSRQIQSNLDRWGKFIDNSIVSHPS